MDTFRTVLGTDTFLVTPHARLCPFLAFSRHSRPQYRAVWQPGQATVPARSHPAA